jgi:hypothetical protein
MSFWFPVLNCCISDCGFGVSTQQTKRGEVNSRRKEMDQFISDEKFCEPSRSKKSFMMFVNIAN